MFPLTSTMLPSVSDTVVEMCTKSLTEFNTKYSGGIDCFFIHADPFIMIMKSLVKVPLDPVRHSKLIILKVNKHFWAKFCTSVLFSYVTFIAAIQWISSGLKKHLHVKNVSNCFPFSIRIPEKYNTVLLVVK